MHALLIRLRRPAVAGLAVVSLASVAAVALLKQPAPDCSGGGRLCPKHERTLVDEKVREGNPEYHGRRSGAAPAGALRAAVNQKSALEFYKAGIPGTDGTWKQYGNGPQIVSGLAQEQLDGGGIPALPETRLQTHSGRVDNFAYDKVNKRLFAAVGTGGIWMSEARNGDVRTIGDNWVSVGDKLPYQANGAVLWTSAGGGTLISAGGDSVMSTGAFDGIGAYWSNDLGVTWTRSNGYPDGVNVFNAETDPGNPRIVYVATSRGLYRSDDAGRNFVNVRLPTGVNAGVDCAGNIDPATPCNLANVVSDVIVRMPDTALPGNLPSSCDSAGCPVLAAVGWRAGRLHYFDDDNNDTGIEQAPGNGLYKSPNGLPGTFVRVDPQPAYPGLPGFTPAERIGRIEMGAAIGPLQNHDYVYAMVQDSEYLNSGAGAEFDPPLDALPVNQVLGTNMNGMFVSADFGETWTRMASSAEIASIPGPYVALIQPGGQGWYDQWINPDPSPSRSVPPVPGVGVPTRLVFGLEELFQNSGSAANLPLNGVLQQGPQDFQNIGYYFSAVGADLTTHPDQHAGIFIPISVDGVPDSVDLGVCVFSGNDGGVFRQCALPGQPFTQNGWGLAANTGFYTLLPYGLGVSKDGTVWYGLQDNGSGHIDPDTRKSFADFGGDGIYAEVDPDDGDIAYTQTPAGGLTRTTDRGATGTDIAPGYLAAPFATWMSMDPLDGNHLMTCAGDVYVTTDAKNVTKNSWDSPYTLGTNPKNGTQYVCNTGDVHGAAIYVGYCGGCGVTSNDTAFQSGISTNVGGSKPPSLESPEDGWRDAKAKGLPNRLITAIEIDPNDPKTVYVGLGFYSSPYRGPGAFGETSTGADANGGHLFKSTDAGETFKDISGSLPKIAVNTILVRNGQLLVGTEIGAFISSGLDGGSWAPLGNGLPNAPISMFKLQPGNPNMLFASTFGRHVWTYEFTGAAAMKAADTGSSGKQGRGLLLGALAPWTLIGLLLMVVFARTRLSRWGAEKPF